MTLFAHAPRLFILLSVLCLGALPWRHLLAQEPIGRVVQTSGRVEAVSPAGVARALVRESEIRSGDLIITGPAGRAQIRMVDGALISFRPGTEFEFSDFVYDGPGGGGDSAVMSLIRGGFRTMSGTIGDGQGDEYRVLTGYASIGIRGTTHEALIDPQTDALYTGVSDGGTTLANAQGTLNLGLGADFDFSETLPGQAPRGLLDLPLALARYDLAALAAAPAPPGSQGDAHEVDERAPPARRAGEAAQNRTGNLLAAAGEPAGDESGDGRDRGKGGANEVLSRFLDSVEKALRSSRGGAPGAEEQLSSPGRGMAGAGGVLVLREAPSSAPETLRPHPAFDLSWGSWDAERPLSPRNDRTHPPEAEPAYWASVSPADMTELRALSARWRFESEAGAARFLGSGSAGELRALHMGFEVDLGSGLISGGQFHALAGEESWNFGFSGQVDGNGAVMHHFTDASVRDPSGLASTRIEGTVGGVFTATGSQAGFATGFALGDESGRHLEGLGVLEGRPE